MKHLRAGFSYLMTFTQTGNVTWVLKDCVNIIKGIFRAMNINYMH